jgi:pimeloyl-ACP methyl ester carboxylesterase
VATYAIVHGAGDSGASWDLVATHLAGRGHEVVAPDLPCDDDAATFSDYADAVVEAVGDRREVTVVAHSLGGFTAPLVCDRLPADGLVLVAGMVPRPGEPAGEWWANTGHWGGDGDIDDVFFHDLSADQAAHALELSRPQSGTPMSEPWPLSAWPDVPTRYLLCRDDRFLPAQFVREMVRDRLGFEPDEIDGGHIPYLSRPGELAERLEGYRDP